MPPIISKTEDVALPPPIHQKRLEYVPHFALSSASASRAPCTILWRRIFATSTAWLICMGVSMPNRRCFSKFWRASWRAARRTRLSSVAVKVISVLFGRACLLCLDRTDYGMRSAWRGGLVGRRLARRQRIVRPFLVLNWTVGSLNIRISVELGIDLVAVLRLYRCAGWGVRGTVESMSIIGLRNKTAGRFKTRVRLILRMRINTRS